MFLTSWTEGNSVELTLVGNLATHIKLLVTITTDAIRKRQSIFNAMNTL